MLAKCGDRRWGTRWCPNADLEKAGKKQQPTNPSSSTYQHNRRRDINKKIMLCTQQQKTYLFRKMKKKKRYYFIIYHIMISFNNYFINWNFNSQSKSIISAWWHGRTWKWIVSNVLSNTLLKLEDLWFQNPSMGTRSVQFHVVYREVYLPSSTWWMRPFQWPLMMINKYTRRIL